MAKAEELKNLKRLVRKFLKAIDGVPFRAVDCDQSVVQSLLRELHGSTRQKNIKTK